MSPHVSDEQMQDYVANRLRSDAAVREIEAHFRICPACARKTLRYYQLRDNFDRILDRLLNPGAGGTKLEPLYRRFPELAEMPGLAEKLAAFMPDTPESRPPAFGKIIHIESRRHLTIQFPGPGSVEVASSAATIRTEFRGAAGAGQPDVDTLSEPIPLADGHTVNLQLYFDRDGRRLTAKLTSIITPYPRAELYYPNRQVSETQNFDHPAATNYLLAEFEDIELNQPFFVFIHFQEH